MRGKNEKLCRRHSRPANPVVPLPELAAHVTVTVFDSASMLLTCPNACTLSVPSFLPSSDSGSLISFYLEQKEIFAVECPNRNQACPLDDFPDLFFRERDS